MKVAIVALTRHGVAKAGELAQRLEGTPLVAVPERFAGLLDGPLGGGSVVGFPPPVAAQVGPLFERFDQIVCFAPIGAVVRLIAPHLKGKEVDPGVVVIDEAGRFVVPVLSGHLGGANAFAEELAALLGATPVLTTASDVQGTIAVDILGRELGWRVEAPKENLVHAAACVVNGEPVAIVGTPDLSWWNRPGPLPENLILAETMAAAGDCCAYLWLTGEPVDPALIERLGKRLVVYRS